MGVGVGVGVGRGGVGVGVGVKKVGVGVAVTVVTLALGVGVGLVFGLVSSPQATPPRIPSNTAKMIPPITQNQSLPLRSGGPGSYGALGPGWATP